MKYLSSSKLMRLQLQDAGFRRQFLTQALVFLHCCCHPGRNEKGAALKPRQVNHPLPPPPPLSPPPHSAKEECSRFGKTTHRQNDDVNTRLVHFTFHLQHLLCIVYPAQPLHACAPDTC